MGFFTRLYKRLICTHPRIKKKKIYEWEKFKWVEYYECFYCHKKYKKEKFEKKILK